ncbi:hypothetical protein EZV62_003710 [Acer yangbiense]|uniref:inositol oxygenase n=1 Tax=Acer yangbiense TaxID=1000413 RepID=A0A5C7II66_9ROSI|nr:hypothetical protein EZV62_003710 [Acer yangbiense]
MTILIDHPQFGGVDEAQEQKVQIDEKKLLLDGGFLVPHTNSFGHTFRDYDAESERQKEVENFYRINHINQTYDFVRKMREEYGKLNRVTMSIWECCELLNDVVDESDPDLDEPQIEHLLQTAEAIRKDYPDEDWLHLTGLIHDLGKVLLHPSFGGLPQWAVVGDTYPVGCAFDESIVHHKYFKENADYNNSAYNTKYGVYYEGCGLNNIMMSWGHDDYMYLVAKENKTTLPSAALFIIRYHSFYTLHRSGAYKHLMNEEDVENLKWLQVFNKYDLYSKSKVQIDVEKVKPYYLSLIEKVYAGDSPHLCHGVLSNSALPSSSIYPCSWHQWSNANKETTNTLLPALRVLRTCTTRDYGAESERQKEVENFYRINHINQTYDFVRKMREEYGKLNRVKMSIWECCELLNDVVDESDPDLDEPQIEHLLQTAEAIRKDYPDEDWLHLTGLIHGMLCFFPSFSYIPG